jgi:uncharacterized cupin superfamily protein
MKVTRIYSDPAGESRFEEIEITLNEQGEIGKLSDKIEVKGLIFRETPADYDYDFHHAPARQFIILLDGIIEIEVSTGEKKIFKGGDILLVEDTTGKGHRTKTINKKVRKSLFITLD